jgi:hypothetical protein
LACSLYDPFLKLSGVGLVRKDISLRRFVATGIVVFALAGLAAVTVWGFIESRAELAQEAEREQPIKPPQRVSLEKGQSVITLDAATQQASGLRTAELQATQHHELLRAYGTVLDLQPLVDLDNSYAVAKAQVNAAQAKLDASRAEFERENTLFKTETSVVTLDKLQAAEAAFHTDEASLASAQAQLRTVEETAKQSWGPILGQQLGEEEQTFARLVQRQEFLVQVTLPPGMVIDSPALRATIQLANGQEQEITYVSPAMKTNPAIQGVSFLYTTPSSTDLLPGMNVLVFLPLTSTVDGVVVPKNAVVWWQGRAWVYVRTGPTTFERHAISTDHPLSEGGYLDSGLTSGTDVVVQGAQMLLSEEFRAQLQIGEEAEGK